MDRAGPRGVLGRGWPLPTALAQGIDAGKEVVGGGGHSGSSPRSVAISSRSTPHGLLRAAQLADRLPTSALLRGVIGALLGALVALIGTVMVRRHT